MIYEFPVLLHLGLLLTGYWVVDSLIRKDGFATLVQKLNITSREIIFAAWIIPSISLAIFWRWEQLEQFQTLRFLALFITGFLAWQAATKDVDPVEGRTYAAERLILIASVFGIYYNPAFLLSTVFLLTTPFGLWQHHATLPMRLTQAMTAYVLLASFLPDPYAPTQVSFMFFAMTIVLSHYLITALAKAMLGPKWYSWVTDNKLHHLAASAYSWGWGRFLSWGKWKKFIRFLKLMEKPMQLSAFSIELLAPLALWHPTAAVVFLCGFAAFHLGVFACSGLLFWDWVLTDLALAYVIIQLPGSITEMVFGPWSVLLGLIVMAVFPLRHKLWKPMPLGWFDTPFTQRVHWKVIGISGKEYGLYNNFMCPHERLYGKVHGCFLAPVQVMTYHLGEVWKHDLRDALRAAGPDPDKLNKVRKQYGINPACEIRQARHKAYLHRFFHEINQGTIKWVLPRGLRWLKAPGDQIFYWGEIQPYTGQEKVSEVILSYREEYFDGNDLIRLSDGEVMRVMIDSAQVPEAVTEPTPKEIDDFLLGLAVGKLIDLPGFGDGYIRGDDGRRVKPAREENVFVPQG